MRPLTLFRRDSARSLLLASWHSPHSLTWSWILRLDRGPLRVERPNFTRQGGAHPTYGVGLGSLFQAHLMRLNGDWHWGLTLLGLALTWSRQQPMWYRDLYATRSREVEQMAARLRLGSIVTFWYTNHRGEVAERRVEVESIEYLADPGYGYQPGLFLSGTCQDRQARRSFALANIEHRWETPNGGYCVVSFGK